MSDSIAQPTNLAGEWELPAWKTALSVVSAVLLAIIMVVAGVWKITDPIAAAVRMNQALVPALLSLPVAIAFGISETFAGVLLLVPRFRRWGAVLSGLLLIAFLLYIGIFYNRLVGDECNCFPWVQRAVGPAFFVGDLIMLGFAVLAGLWARPSRNLRSAALVLGAVCVFAGVSYGVAVSQSTGTMAPDTILVDGQPYNLHEGRVLLYFFDPECTHCLFAAQEMTGYSWVNTQIIAVPIERKQLADQFMEAAGLQAPLTSDSDKLRAVWKFGDPPYGVALENGRQVAELTVFEGDQPKAALMELGFVK
jgi:hypothetical protein